MTHVPARALRPIRRSAGSDARAAVTVAGLALLAWGLSRRGRRGLALLGAAALGGAVAFGLFERRGAQLGLLPGPTGRRRLDLRRSVTIARPRAEVFRAWSASDGLAERLGIATDVERGAGGVSRWSVPGPGGRSVSIDMDRVEARDGERLTWRSVPGESGRDLGAEVVVELRDAPGERGTEVFVHVRAEPRGPVGRAIAAALGTAADLAVREALRRFKQRLEAGEIPTNALRPEPPRAVAEVPIDRSRLN